MNYGLLGKKISDWIKDYTLTHKLKTLVIGVSGGIDSAVTSTLAAKTGLPLYALNMPIKQKTDQEKLSDLQLSWLKNNYFNTHPIKINLTNSFTELVFAWKETGHENIAQHLHAQANSRSRLRMTTLYHVASATHGLVVGTGNKVEDYGIGFFTKYGDGGVDIAPIADLYKSEVYHLAKSLGIEKAIQSAEPTDGLWDDDRDDQSQIGCSYIELEKVMRHHEGEKVRTNEKAKLIYHNLHRANQHKIHPIPTFKLNEHGFSH